MNKEIKYMRSVILSLALASSGCATVYVPKTDKAEACLRSCYQQEQKCRALNAADAEEHGLLGSRDCSPERCFNSCSDTVSVQCL